MTPLNIEVLLIDDDEMLLEISKEFLELDESIKIDTAVSYNVAVDMIKFKKYDVIISDYQMNHKTGIDLLKELKAINNIPFILFTGKSREEVAIEALNSGATFYLQKGVHPASQFAELTNMIKQAHYRHSAEISLKESEERYRRLFEAAQDGIFLINSSTGKIFDANPYIIKLTGYSLEELIGKNLWEIGFIKDKIIAQDSFSELINKKYVRYLNIPLQHKNGEMRHVEFVSNVYTAGGEEIIQCNIRDNTDRFLAEEALEASEQKYRLIFSGSPDAISVTRMSDGLIVSANDGFSKIAGAPLEEIIGKSSRDINVYKNWEYRVAIAEELKTKGNVNNREIEFNTKRGEIIGSMSASVIDMNDEKYIVSITRDVTEQKQLEKEINESEAKYRAIFEQSPIAIELYDEQGVLSSVNPSCLKLFGVESIDVINKFSLFDDPNVTDEVKTEMCKGETLRFQSVFDFEKVKSNKLYPTTKNGLIWVDITITPMIEDKTTIARYLIQIHDNTERILAIESSREANRKLNLLSSITRHDIKNQISAVEGHLAMMEIKTPELLTSEHFQKAERSIRQISTMIQFTKEYENIGVNTPTWQNVKEMILNASRDLSLDDIKLIIDIPDNFEIYADQLTVKVFHNLMHNAIRHGLVVKNIRFYLEEIDGEKCIICEDDGIGVASDMKEALFTKAFGNGHGFGMFLSREILAITGIEIKEIGTSGAKFVLTPPRAVIRTI